MITEFIISMISPQGEILLPKQRLLLWRVAAAGGGLWLRALSPIPEPTLRRELEQRGLLNQLLRTDDELDRQGTWLQLTADGWNWTALNLSGDFAQHPAIMNHVPKVLEAVRSMLKTQGLAAKSASGVRRERRLQGAPQQPQRQASSAQPAIPSQIVDASLLRHITTYLAANGKEELRVQTLCSLMEMDPRLVKEGLLRLRQVGKLELVQRPSRDHGSRASAIAVRLTARKPCF